MRGRFVPFGKPWIGDEELSEVKKVLSSRWLGLGPKVKELETGFAKYVGTDFAVAVSSGTAALHLALLACGVGPGDEVILPTFSYVSTANAVLYTQARPVLVDIKPDTYNIDPMAVEKAVTRKTKALIPVHYAGQPSEMDAIVEIAEQYRMTIIEDAAEALGAVYKGKMVGCIGGVGCFSFAWNKVMTTGEGGMITTDDDEKSELSKSLRDHAKREGCVPLPMIGYNYKMNDIQAAIGIVQLKKVEEALDKRMKIARYLSKKLDGLPYVTPPTKIDHVCHVYQFYTIRIEDSVGNISRDRVVEELRGRGVDSRVYFHPIHLHPLYKRVLGYHEGMFPVAEDVSRRVISLPIYSEMSIEEAEYVIDMLTRILEEPS